MRSKALLRAPKISCQKKSLMVRSTKTRVERGSPSFDLAPSYHFGHSRRVKRLGGHKKGFKENWLPWAFEEAMELERRGDGLGTSCRHAKLVR